jgi:AcrR family transcriptional regulator
MQTMSSPTKSKSDHPPQRGRTYDGTLRKERAAETRERIIAAGSELLHRESVRDWKKLTVRAVAEKAGVNERTVYRCFGNERGLRDALLQRNEKEAGIDLSDMQLGDIGKVTEKILGHVSQYPRDPRPPLVPTLLDAKRRQQEALIGAVDASAELWTQQDQLVAAAMLDVQWSVATYERLVENWQIDHEQAVRGITWVLGLIEQSIRNGHPPP